MKMKGSEDWDCNSSGVLSQHENVKGMIHIIGLLKILRHDIASKQLHKIILLGQ
jgi:hypothetical protein